MNIFFLWFDFDKIEIFAPEGTQKSEANATVSILPQHLPTIQVLTLDSLVPPYKKFVATGNYYFVLYS